MMGRTLVPAFGQVLFAVGFAYAGVAAAAFVASQAFGSPLGFDVREAIFFLSLGLGTILAAWGLGDRPMRRSLALSWPTDGRIAVRFMAMLLLVLAIEAAVVLAGLLGPIEDLRAMSNSERSGLGFLNAVVLAPVIEEGLFRGLLFTRLRQRLAAWPAVAIVTVAFGLLHAENGLLHVVSVLPAGAFLSYAREVSGGIGLPILLHACMNLAIVVAGSLL